MPQALQAKGIHTAATTAIIMAMTAEEAIPTHAAPTIPVVEATPAGAMAVAATVAAADIKKRTIIPPPRSQTLFGIALAQETLFRPR
ncbi:MAG: hypothetical protein WCD79_00840 [Chthoniobacteraceae bacterium]